MLISALTAWAVGAQLASAATADEWRDRAIYQCAPRSLPL
jgi:hypothetical protein